MLAIIHSFLLKLYRSCSENEWFNFTCRTPQILLGVIEANWKKIVLREVKLKLLCNDSNTLCICDVLSQTEICILHQKDGCHAETLKFNSFCPWHEHEHRFLMLYFGQLRAEIEYLLLKFWVPFSWLETSFYVKQLLSLSCDEDGS